MKRNIFLFASALILSMALSAFNVFTASTSGVNYKIALLKPTGGTRSATAAEVEAFICSNHTITVEVENYTGTVCVGVTGVGGTLQETVQVYDNALIVIDLSTLPHGDYLLTITLGNELYEGYFEY